MSASIPLRFRCSVLLLSGLGLGLGGCNLFDRTSQALGGEPGGGEGVVSIPPSVAGPVGGQPARLAPNLTAAKTPPPITGGTLAISADESLLVASDPDRDLVHIVEPGAHSVRSVALPAGSLPSRTVVDDAGVAHVVLRGTGELARIDLAAGSVERTASVCAEPRGLLHDAKAQALTVACASGRLVSLSASDYTVTGSTSVDADLRDVLPGPNGSLLVSRYRSAELLRVAGGKLGQRTRALGATRNATFSSDGNTRQAKAEATVAWRTVTHDDGSVWMLHQESQTTTVEEVPGGYGSGCDGVTSGAITEFGADGTPKSVLPITLNGINVDMAVAPDRSYVAVASPGAYVNASSSVNVYSTSTSVPATLDGAPFANSGCSFGATNVVSIDAQATALVFGKSGHLYVFSREPASLSEYTIAPTPTDAFNPFTPLVQLELRQRLSLSDVSVRDTGHDMFHMAVGGSGLSCASCHGEAADDGHVWDFSKSGPRRTQHLRGGVLKRAPFHWSGDLPSMQSLMDTVMTGRMSGFAVTPEYTSALGTWLDAQPAERSDAPDEAAVARGKLLFESAEVACASCHAGDDLSRQKGADVGTGGTFEVPSLKGVSTHPPFMHDGCAQTLRDRFDAPCGGDKHGNTKRLSAAQLDDLIAYLESL